MRPEIALKHEFVEVMPQDLQEHKLYVSLTYNTAVHKCCCGCGRKVVTPLSPAAWRLTYDGRTVSLEPSVGNWSFPCQSHYWITHGMIRWVGHWSRDMIEAGRELEALAREKYYAATSPRTTTDPGHESGEPVKARRRVGILARLRRRLWG